MTEEKQDIWRWLNTRNTNRPDRRDAHSLNYGQNYVGMERRRGRERRIPPSLGADKRRLLEAIVMDILSLVGALIIAGMIALATWMLLVSLTLGAPGGLE